jgi:hypothetical protein
VLDDDAIRGLVRSLSRPHPSGGAVIERAAILASGADSVSILAWIDAHHAEPEELAPAAVTGGLHGGRTAARRPSAPLRYVLPAGAFGTDSLSQREVPPPAQESPLEPQA